MHDFIVYIVDFVANIIGSFDAAINDVFYFGDFLNIPIFNGELLPGQFLVVTIADTLIAVISMLIFFSLIYFTFKIIFRVFNIFSGLFRG